MITKNSRRSGDKVLLQGQKSSLDDDFSEIMPLHASSINSRITRSKAACSQKRKGFDKSNRVVKFDSDVVEVECPEINLKKKFRRNANIGKSDVDSVLNDGPALKLWEYYTPKRNFGNRPINVHCNKEISAELKQRLCGGLYERFKATCFGHFLELPAFHVQNQVLVSLLFLEVVRPVDDAMFFIVNNQKIKFGLKEFAIVTGLKCHGDFLKDYRCEDGNRLVKKYFGGVEKVSKSALDECFKSKMWDCDEDAIKISALYLINTFLYSTKNSETTPHYIDADHFDIVESGEWETYPWGYKIFHATIESLHNKVCVWKSSYRFAGMPYALLVWFFECCPSVNGKLANRVGNKVPRILNWEVTRHFSFNEVQKCFFSLSGDKMVVQNITPNDFELDGLNLLEVEEFTMDDEFVCHSDDDSPPVNLAGQSSCDNELFVTKADFIKEMVSLKQNQIDMKHDILKNNLAVDGLKDLLVATAERFFNELDIISKKIDTNFAVQAAGTVDNFTFDGFGSDHEVDPVEVNNVDSNIIPTRTGCDNADLGTSVVDIAVPLDKPNMVEDVEVGLNDASADVNVIDVFNLWKIWWIVFLCLFVSVPRRLEFDDVASQEGDGVGIVSLCSQELNIIDESVQRKLQESAKRKGSSGVGNMCSNVDAIQNSVMVVDGSSLQNSAICDRTVIDKAGVESLSTEDLNIIDDLVEKTLLESAKRREGLGLDSITTDEFKIMDCVAQSSLKEVAVQKAVRNSVDVVVDKAAGGLPNFRLFDTQEEAEIFGKNVALSVEGSNSVISEDGLDVDKYALVIYKELGSDIVGGNTVEAAKTQSACSNVNEVANIAHGNISEQASISEDGELNSLFRDIDEFSEKDYGTLQEVVPVHGKIKERMGICHKAACRRESVRFHRSRMLFGSRSLVRSRKKVSNSVFSTKHPFVVKPWRRVDAMLSASFSTWIKNRLMKTREPPYHFTANILRPSFDFGVCVVSSKDWFYGLYSGDNPLQETHIDVVLYYLRKMGMNDPAVQGRFTTTDCLFDSTIRDVYKLYLKNNKDFSVVAENHLISDYMKGISLRCNMPWPSVDDVLLPIKVFEDWHWILGRISFKHRVIYVYDQKLDNHFYDDELIRAVEPYAIIIPQFLSAIGFYDIRDDLNPTEYIFGDKPVTDKWDILHIYDMTGVPKFDYGVFALTFAEHFIHGREMPPSGCNIRRFRKRLGELLWDYGIKKQEANQQSDVED